MERLMTNGRVFASACVAIKSRVAERGVVVPSRVRLQCAPSKGTIWGTTTVEKQRRKTNSGVVAPGIGYERTRTNSCIFSSRCVRFKRSCADGSVVTAGRIAHKCERSRGSVEVAGRVAQHCAGPSRRIFVSSVGKQRSNPSAVLKLLVASLLRDKKSTAVLYPPLVRLINAF
jgi:hypothetical protein